jgi:hypothetical protein
MNVRAALSLLFLPCTLLACSDSNSGGAPQGCAHGTSGPDCIPMTCELTPPDPAPEACTTAADCTPPEGQCYLQDYCDDGPGYLFASYANPTCKAGACVWEATASSPGDCPSTMPAEGSPCDASFGCTVSGPEGCAYQAMRSCGLVDVSVTCEGGVIKVRSVCDCAGADEASCNQNAACEWRSPDCFDVAQGYCAPVGVACGAPGCASCGPVTNKACGVAGPSCRCGGGTDPMACLP